jgi:6-phospho-beta-glucosidase
MKLVLIGAGVRSPMFVAAVLRRIDRLPVDEFVLLDIDEERSTIFGTICRALVAQSGSRMRLTSTVDADRALEGADHVVTSIRVGLEEGRVADERIALRHGVLGQETTGPGGFAMALRNVPEILRYARLAHEANPEMWFFNFTNPAGLVTQALRDSGIQHAIGICDSGNAAQHAVAGWHHLDPRELRAEVFGLNHLSWTRCVWRGEDEVLAGLMRDPAFIAGTNQAMFEPDLLRLMGGLWLNEYLYYWYYYERALASIQSDERTRGEEIVSLTQGLMEQLRSVDVEAEPERALAVFRAYQDRRVSTYMHYAGSAEGSSTPDALSPAAAAYQTAGIDEGYAGVTLNVIEAIHSGRHLNTSLNVPNMGAIAGIADDDVVEVSCEVVGERIEPVAIGEIPETTAVLMRTVKLYERLTIDAILNESRDDAIRALMTHPMVMSYSRAKDLVLDYGVAHQRWIPWLA